LAVALLGGTFVFGSITKQEGEAQVVPGTVAQSASDSSSGLTVDAERAVFSATGVDVWLHIRSDEPGAKVAGVLPSDAELAGNAGLSAAVHSDGRTVLRFPPAAWPHAGPTAQLSIRAVRLLSPEGKDERIDGSWQLAIELPQGAEAERARALRTLSPVVTEVAGSKLVVETLKTASATIVRYQLPANVSSFSPPMLRAGASTLAPARSQQAQGPQGSHEVWFEATPDNTSLVLVFDRLAASDPTSKPWTLKATLAPFQPAAPAAAELIKDQPVTWELQADSSPEPALKGILWRRLPDRVELEITVGGLWAPQAGGPPVVLGDGVEIKVDSVGTYPAFGERGDETRIAFRLPSQTVPRSLVVIGGGGRIAMLPPLEVTLQD
jgi:hypothetical protein